MILDIRCAWCPECETSRDVTVEPQASLIGSHDRETYWIPSWVVRCPAGHKVVVVGGFEWRRDLKRKSSGIVLAINTGDGK